MHGKVEKENNLCYSIFHVWSYAVAVVKPQISSIISYTYDSI